MSWLYSVPGDTWATIRQLDPEVQEAVLDELEELVDDADERWAFGHVTEVRLLDASGITYTADFEMSLNPDSRVLTLLDVGVYDTP